jgi:hypothetical protein
VGRARKEEGIRGLDNKMGKGLKENRISSTDHIGILEFLYDHKVPRILSAQLRKPGHRVSARSTFIPMRSAALHEQHQGKYWLHQLEPSMLHPRLQHHRPQAAPPEREWVHHPPDPIQYQAGYQVAVEEYLSDGRAAPRIALSPI